MLTNHTNPAILFLADGVTVRRYSEWGTYPLVYVRDGRTAVCPACVQEMFDTNDREMIGRITDHGANHDESLSCEICEEMIEAC